jgi:hypothetical protein
MNIAEDINYSSTDDDLVEFTPSCLSLSLSLSLKNTQLINFS